MESQAEEFFKILQEKDKFFVHIVIKREDGTERPFSDFYSQKDLKEVYDEFMVPNQTKLCKVRKVKTFQIYGDFSSLKEEPSAYKAYLETMLIYRKASQK
jgi:hypothetical protein